MYVTLSDFNSKLLGSVVHASNGDVNTYGIVRCYRNNAISLYLTCTNNNNRNRSVSSDYTDGIYNWKKVNAELLSSRQVSYISLVRMLIDKVKEKFEVELDINEYSVIFGSHIGYFRYILDRRGLRHEICSCICIPVEPYGYLYALVRSDCVLVYLFGSSAMLISERQYTVSMVRFVNNDFVNKVFYDFVLLDFEDESIKLIESLIDYVKDFASLDKLSEGLCIKDLITVVEAEVLPYNRLESDGKVIQLEKISGCSREDLGEICEEVTVDSWYRSSKGLYYALLGNSFVYLTIDSVYSCSGVVLYKELISHVEKCNPSAEGTGFIGNGNVVSTVIGRFRGSEKRKELLKVCFLTDMAVSTIFNQYAMTCEICDDLGVLQVLDGANQVDVYIKDSKLCTRNWNVDATHLVIRKDTNNSFYTVGDVECNVKDIKRLHSIIVKADKNIFTKGNFKLVIYSYNSKSEEVLLDNSKNVIDTCYNFDDCLRICKSRVGKEFLIVRFEKGTISGQWKVTVSKYGNCCLSKIV